MISARWLRYLAKARAEEAGLGLAKIRGEHRAAWKWTQGGKWYTQPWGQSVQGIGFDVTCACGWESRTGGAIYERVREAHAEHILRVIEEAAR